MSKAIAGLGWGFFALLLLGCARSAPVRETPVLPIHSEPAPPPPPKPVCVVLSVGAEQGLSHIGFLRAVRDKGVPVDCVVGTSMGALVGALYAADPQQDVAVQYEALFARYHAEAESDARSRATWTGLLAAGAVAATGGGAAIALGAGAGGGALGAISVRSVEWERLHEVLDAHFEGRTIESLPVRFATSHQHLTRSGARSISVRGGEVATEVARSIANPLIFGDLEAEEGSRIDPGLDRVAAVPVQIACDLFPHHQMLVSNVTGEDVYVAERMKCPYQNISISESAVDPVSAMTGGDGFELLVQKGYTTALSEIDWDVLPSNERPAVLLPNVDQPPVQTLQVTLSVEARGAWDPFAGQPDMVHETTVRACSACDGHGTSASTKIKGEEQKDRHEASWDLGVLLLRSGFALDITLSDVDGMSDDPMGAFEIEYEKPGRIVREVGGVQVTVHFDEIVE